MDGPVNLPDPRAVLREMFDAAREHSVAEHQQAAVISIGDQARANFDRKLSAWVPRPWTDREQRLVATVITGAIIEAQRVCGGASDEAAALALGMLIDWGAHEHNGVS